MHGAHAVCPSWSWKVPAAHLSQTAEPALLAAVPLLHKMQEDVLLLPGTGLALPGSHARHQLLLDVPGSGLYVPAATKQSRLRQACGVSLA